MKKHVSTTENPGDVIHVSRIIAANCFDLSPEFETTEEKHSDWEFVYVDSGEIRSYTENSSVRISSGGLIFHDPGEVHNTVCNRKRSASIFSVIFKCESEEINHFKGKVLQVPTELTSLLKQLIHECSTAYNISVYPLVTRPDAPLGGEQVARIFLEAFLLLLLRADKSEISKKSADVRKKEEVSPLAQQMCQYLHSHIYDQVTLDMLSKEFRYGKNYLCDIFRKNIGCSIMTYYLDLKISEAKRLLREKQVTVNEISAKLGFESPSYFSRAFKKRTGHAPRSFRKMLINDAMLRRK